MSNYDNYADPFHEWMCEDTVSRDEIDEDEIYHDEETDTDWWLGKEVED